MNVLITCAGRRNYLVNWFREPLQGRGRVIAVDASPNAPALIAADAAFVVPPLDHPDYLDRLLAICAEQQVGLLISLNDFELPLISHNQERFRAVGTRPAISSPDVIHTCLDKWKTYEFLRAQGIPTARTFLTVESVQDALSRGEIDFPLAIKPRCGSGSAGMVYVRNAVELRLTHALAIDQQSRLPGHRGLMPASGALVFQEWLEGEEYGLDVVHDLEGVYAGCFARRKLLMRAGETDRAVTTEHSGLRQLALQLSRALGHIGNLDCDVFVQEDRCTVLEMNPRFGGGYPFSHLAGANLPRALVAWHLGEPVDPGWLTPRPDVMGAKHDGVALISPSGVL